MHTAGTGGMLGTWMRIKYPHILDGMVAGSAPIWSYLGEVMLCHMVSSAADNVMDVHADDAY